MGANTLFIITNTIKLRSEPLHNLWLLPSTLSTAQSTWCLSNPVYNSGASPTVVDEDVQFDLECGEGSAQGEYLEDIVWVEAYRCQTLFLVMHQPAATTSL
jgi:hypothetical protein